MAIVGRTYAVADLKHVHSAGLLAWLLGAGTHIYFLIGFANRLLVMLQWAISFVTKRTTSDRAGDWVRSTVGC